MTAHLTFGSPFAETIPASAFTNSGGDGLQVEEHSTVTLVKPTFGGNDEDSDINAEPEVEVIIKGG